MLSWFRTDISLKLASVVLALFVWMYLRTEAQTVQVFQVPLEMADLPRDLAIVGELPDSVMVRVRANYATAQSLSPGRFQARVRLNAAQPGEFEVPLTTDIVRAPFGVEILRVDPPSLHLIVDRRISREVPIIARIEGEPAEGYEQRGHTLSPRVAVVEGPERIVSRVKGVLTETVDIGGATESFVTVVGLVPDRGGVRIVSEGQATLKVEIEEKQVTRTYEGVPLEPTFPQGVDYRVEIQPETIDVVLRGPRAALDALGPEAIRAVLDLEGMGPREAFYTVRPQIILEQAGDVEVEVDSLSRPTVNVKIGR